jgi:two-component system CheB/CheR fusion protein
MRGEPDPIGPDEAEPRGSVDLSDSGEAVEVAAGGGGPEGPLIAVGIAASAGGLEALRDLVGQLPAVSRLAYVVVQHLSPSHRSLLVDLLRRETALQVLEIAQGMTPAANTVYITPPGVNVELRAGALHLTEARRPGIPKPSADHFLASLASEYGDNAIAVVLSGTGTDGAKGVRAVKASGGFTFAQDPTTAKYDGMPRAAIETGCVDVVLPPAQVASELARLARLSSTAELMPPGPPAPPVYNRILGLVHKRTGTDFLNYKETTIRRRLVRRMLATNSGSLDEYELLLRENPAEIDRLYQDVLISVTSFFRDREAYEALAACIPELLAAKQPGDEIRVWVAGCATGEEAYSVALLLAEALGPQLSTYRVQVFATDIDESALAQARRGAYHVSGLADMEDRRLRGFFVPSGDAFQVSKALREMVIFARQDLTRDPPFLRVDLVTCRNVLIYLNSPTQKRILELFHYALRPGGYLFLGKSESPEQVRLFAAVDARRRIYTRKDVPAVPRPPAASFHDPGRPAQRPAASRVRKDSLEDRVDAVARAAYLPPGVVVDREGEVRYVLGDVNPFLRLPPGRAGLNALGLIGTELQADLRALMVKAERSGQAERGVRTTLREGGTRARLAVHPVPGDPPEDTLFLVSFEQAPPESAVPVEEGSRSELEQELAATREHLQTVIEELETSNEELQSLNEELQSSNEELQSTNEELETANEELQSTNEELTTVNEELQSKSSELAATNADLENVKDSLPYPLLVVDAKMRVSIANRAAAEVLGVTAQDVGEVVTTLELGVSVPDLLEILERVIRLDREEERQLTGARDYVVRVRPYHDETGRARGAVIAFWDNTELRNAEADLKERAAQVELQARALDAVQHGVVIADALAADQPIVYVNPAFERITGYPARDALGRNCRFLQGPESDTQARDRIRDAIARGEPCTVLTRNYRKDGSAFWNELTIAPVRDGSGRLTHFIGTQIDVSAWREGQDRGRLAVSVFENTREGILITDARRRIVSVNPAFTAITQYQPAEVLGRTPAMLQSGRHDQLFYRALWDAVYVRGEWQGEIWNRRRDGEAVPLLLSVNVVRDPEGEVTHYVGIYTDIAPMKEAERRLQNLAYQDALTGLPNRVLVMERLRHAIDRAKRERGRVVLLFLDLDRFKLVNDTLGHDLGDQLLCQVAVRVQGALRQMDTVGRLGGDEFLVVIEDLEDPGEVHHVATRLLKLIAQPCQLGGREIHPGASIGIAVYPEDGEDVETLLRNADTAMYRAKAEGRNTYRFYAAAMNALWLERLQLESDLRRALDAGELDVHYQPRVDLVTGAMTAAEALLRWNHPRRGLLAATDFYPVAEESGLAVELDRWVLRRVGEHYRTLLGAGGGPTRISVNISTQHLHPHAGLRGAVAELLEQVGVGADWLELELLEGGMMPDGIDGLEVIRPLKDFGIRLAIDDFGKGYSNLAYLRQLPVDTVKVDQSFVGGVTVDPNDAAIVEAVIAMTRALGLLPVAEGVETVEQAEFLRRCGCAEGQGYAFAAAMPLADLVAWRGAAGRAGDAADPGALAGDPLQRMA